jgi:glycosyltransferase involved in cell wall biosynthesis
LGALNYGGLDRILSFARNISKQGVDVYLIDRSLVKSPRSLIIDQDKYYAVKNGKLHERYYPFYVRFLFAGMLKVVQHVLNLWLSVLTRSTVSEISYSHLLDPYLIVKLFFVSKRERIDVIQCEFPFLIFSSFVVKKILGIPLVYDAHGIESERLGSMANVGRIHVGVMKKIEIISSKISDAVFVVSECDRDHLLSWGIQSNKVTVIPNSVDSLKFNPKVDGKKIREFYKLDSNKFVLIFHGLFDYYPNKIAAEILIDIFPILLKKYNSLYLFLIGRNPPVTDNSHIIRPGFVKNLPEYIAAADLAVVPLIAGGGTKIKMLEYMACGKAVVSTLKGVEGLDLQNRRDILMTNYPDSKFVNLIFEAIEDENLRKRIGLNARKKIELFYNWEITAKKAIQVYTSVLGN